MIRAVFLDLDDTLLHYPQGAMKFVGQYLAMLAENFPELPNLAQQVVGNVRHMMEDISPVRQNQSFYGDLFSGKLSQETLQAFYRTQYPTLQSLTKPDPVASQLIDYLIKKGYMVVIATNPIYPQVATQARLRWAGIDPQVVDLARLTHAENSHFTKPHPQYYEEICAHLDIEPYEVVMVGDNWEHDIVAGASAGMRTFWIENDVHPKPSHVNNLADGQGRLQDFYQCVTEQDWLKALTPKPIEASHIVPRLMGNMGALWGTLEPIEDRFWHQRPYQDEWTPLEVVLHLYEHEYEVQRPRLERIVEHDNPFLKPENEPFQPCDRDVSDQIGWDVARAFVAEREKTVAFLLSLPAEVWQRPARHSIYGPTTFLEMASLTSRHDHLHIRQLCQTIGQCE